MDLLINFNLYAIVLPELMAHTVIREKQAMNFNIKIKAVSPDHLYQRFITLSWSLYNHSAKLESAMRTMYRPSFIMALVNLNI